MHSVLFMSFIYNFFNSITGYTLMYFVGDAHLFEFLIIQHEKIA